MDRKIFLFLLLLSFCACKPTATVEIPSPPDEVMVRVPAGWFTMGVNDGRRSNEPKRQVHLDAYAIMRMEVTRAEFAKFVQATGYQAAGWDQAKLEITGDMPVTGVLWEDARAYCEWAGMRLPTEAEWEKAARGTDGRRYPWGNEWDPTLANTRESSHGNVLPAGSFPGGASPYGVLDMTGNASEWVADYFTFDYYTYAPDHNPQGPDIVMDHCLRGGSYDAPAQWATTYFRNSSHSAKPNQRVGFRCAKSVEE